MTTEHDEPISEDSGTPEEQARIRRRRVGMVVLQSALILGLVIALGFWLVREWPTVVATFESLSIWAFIGSSAAAAFGAAASALVWRGVLQGLGQPVGVASALVVYLVGQLAKFIPGGFWAFIYQVALGVPRGLAKTPALLAGPIAAGIALVMSAVVISVGLARIDIPFAWLLPLIGALAIVLALARPDLANRLLIWGLRVLRRGEREVRFTRLGLAGTLGWALLSWVCYGFQLWLLTNGLAGTLTIFETMAIAAAAQSLGFLAFIFPSGIGVREAVITAGLAGIASPAVALTIAVAARATSTVGDLSAAGAARLIELAVRRRQDQREPRDS